MSLSIEERIDRIEATLEIIIHQSGVGNRVKDSLITAKIKEIKARESLQAKPETEEEKAAAQKELHKALEEETQRLTDLIDKHIEAYHAKQKKIATEKKAETKRKAAEKRDAA